MQVYEPPSEKLRVQQDNPRAQRKGSLSIAGLHGEPAGGP
jgi:hypothetical protein